MKHNANIINIINNIIQIHDHIISQLYELESNKSALLSGTTELEPKVKYAVVREVVSPHIKTITDDLLSIIRFALTEDEYRKLHKVIIKLNYYNKSSSLLHDILEGYKIYGKGHFIKETLDIYFLYRTYSNCPHDVGMGRSYKSNIFNVTHDNYIQNKYYFEKRSVFILDWFNHVNRFVDAGSKVPIATQVLKSVVKDAIFNTGDTKLESIWDYIDYTFDEPFRKDGCNLYKETADSGEEDSFPEKQIVIYNSKNEKERVVKYKSLYSVIQKVKKEMT